MTAKTIEVAAAVIRRGDRILATQRGYGEHKDGWEFPGGKLEPGETPREALAREIREELAVDVRVGDCLADVEYAYPGFRLRMRCFWCRIPAGEPVLREHEAARWLALDDLDSVAWLPADRLVLPHVREEWNSFGEGNGR